MVVVAAGRHGENDLSGRGAVNLTERLGFGYACPKSVDSKVLLLISIPIFQQEVTER